MGFRSGECVGQSNTPTPWSFNQLLVLLAMWNQHLKKAGQQKEAWSAPKCIGKQVQWRWFSKSTKEDFGPLGNSPVLILLSPGKTPLTITLAKFLDTSVCGGSWCLDPSFSPFLVKFTQILESILLDNPPKAAVLSVGCASFSSTLFPSTQLSVNMLGYSTLWTASFFGNECLWLTLLVKGVNNCLLDNCQISSLPHDCVA